MDIRLIALDLDGTLLDSQKRLSSRNRQALTECLERGIHIVPTTGRTVSGIPSVVRELPGVRYAITTNGAVVEDMKEDLTLSEGTIPWELALKILKIIDQYHVMYDPYIERRGITEPRFYEHLTEYGLRPELQEVVRMTRDVYPNIIEFLETCRKPVEKINLFFPEIEERTKVRKVLEEIDGIIITSSMPMNLEINAPGATKGGGIRRLAEHLGLKREQTMAMGDGENDFSMILEAGIGVAMKNGRPDLCKAADYITDTNDEDGVASAIYRFVLEAEL